MSEVVDSLVVTLGLDASDFKKGQEQASASIKGLKNSVSSSASEMASAIANVGLKFTGLFLGIKAVEDVIGIFKDLHTELAHLGYDSHNLGIAANELRDWGEVAKSAGGSADEAAQSINDLQRSIFNLRFKGQVSEQLAGFQRLGINPIDPRTGTAKDFKTLMFETATALQNRIPDQVTRYQTATGYLHLPEGLATAVSQGTKALQEFYDRAKSSTQVTQKQADAQSKLEQSLVHLDFNVKGAAAQILDHLTPALKEMTDDLNKVTAPLKWIADLFGGGSVPGFLGTKIPLPPDARPLFNSIGDYFKGKWAEAKSARARAGFADKFAEVERDMGLPAGLLDRIATTESGYDASKVGGKGELGIFQLMPQFHAGAGQDSIIDAQMAASDLRDNFRRLGSWPAAIAAYNEGVSGYQAGKVPNNNAAYVNRVLGTASSAQPTPSINGAPISANRPAGGGVSVDIGEMTVNTQATDASGIASDMAAAVRRKFMVFQSDGGVVA